MPIKQGILLSTRCVQTQNLQPRLNFNRDGTPTGLNVASYADHKGMISPSSGFTIVQVESLERVIDEPIELLVLDEY